MSRGSDPKAGGGKGGPGHRRAGDPAGASPTDRGETAQAGTPGGIEETVVFSLSAAETESYGARLGRGLLGGELILLTGELGAGKTVFVKGIASSLEIDPDDVNSPTFVLVQPYEGRVPLFHVDLYRIDAPAEFDDLGIEEMLEAGGVVAVEWGEKLPPEMKEGALEIRFTDLGEDSRRISFRAWSEDEEG